MLLADKGYFDYDYEKFGMLEDGKDWAETVRSKEEVESMLSGFGFGTKKKLKTTEEIQAHIIKQMED